MANLDLVGAVQAEINHQYAVTAYDFSVKGDRPVNVKFGPQGAIGSSAGQEKPSGSFKFAVPKTGLEFDWTALFASGTGFTVSFPVGAERHQVYGAKGTARALANNPESGETTWSVDWVGTEWIRIA